MNNLIWLISLLCELFWAVGFIFTCCEFGERVTNAYYRVSCAVDQLNWYSMPIALWKMIPIITISVQVPVCFQCFGSIPCSRGVFRQVNFTNNCFSLLILSVEFFDLILFQIANKAFSWFTVLRKFGN